MVDANGQYQKTYLMEFELLDEAINALDSVIVILDERKLKQDELSLFEYFLVTQVYKFASSLRAISLLCADGFTEDTKGILRKLIEATVAVRFMRENVKKRAEQFWRHGVVRTHHLLPKILECDRLSSEFRSEIEAALAVNAESYDRVKQLFPLDKNGRVVKPYQDNWSGKGFRAMAADVGMCEIYVRYCVLSGSIHTGTDDLSIYFDASKIAFGSGNDPQEIPSLILTAVESLLMTLEAVASQFQLSDNPDVAKLVQRFQCINKSI